MYKAIIPECYIDTCLINVLLNVKGTGVNHGKSNTAVAKKMIDTFSDGFCIGIIDNDKKKIPYLTDFHLINNSIADYSLLYRHKEHSKHHFFIKLCPESETWICRVSKELKIDLGTEFNLPDTPVKLLHSTKSVSSKHDPNFIRLFKSIVTRSEQTNFEPVLKLKHWLRLLADNTYQVDINELKK